MYEGPIQDLIDELGRLPGIGPKSAQRLAFHILAADRDDVLRLADVLNWSRRPSSSVTSASTSLRTPDAGFAVIHAATRPRSA